MNRERSSGTRTDHEPDAASIAVDAVSIGKLALVIDSLGKKAFDQRLLDWLAGLVAFDSALILIYAERQRPRIVVDALDNPDRRNTARHYVDAAYLLDPFYRHARQSSEACLIQLGDIAPDDFSRSDYVDTYYRRSAVRDEINFLIPIDGMTYAVCLERSVRRPSFSMDDLATLRLLLPLVKALATRHWPMVADRHEGGSPDDEHLRLERILADFGSHVLTPREREVVGFMLRGFALAQIADRLKISAETARVHRRNIYDKLGISSLAELFSLALAELAGSR